MSAFPSSFPFPLTLASQEAPPEKKSKPKPSKFNKQYSGPGTFVPSGDVPPSLMSGAGSRSSRMSSNGPNDSIPSSLRSSISSATADLYTPPYEQRNRLSPVDQMANDFGQLNVADHRRRESFPVCTHSNLTKPSSLRMYSLFRATFPDIQILLDLRSCH